jgi:hypothetical protein
VEGLNDARTKLADCFSILLRYHGVFCQGKRGKALPARSIIVHAGGAAPGTTSGVGAMLIISLVGVSESAPGASVLSRR